MGMVSGEWLLTGATLSHFNGTSAAIAYTPVVEKSGAIFKYVLKVKDNATLKNTTIKTDAVIKNGATTVESNSGSVTVKVICKNHTFGAWSQVKAATCTEKGNVAYKYCSECEKYFADNASLYAESGKTDATSFVTNMEQKKGSKTSVTLRTRPLRIRWRS